MPRGTLSALKQVICIPFAYSLIFLGSPQTGADTVNVLSPEPDLTESKGVKIVLCVDRGAKAAEPGKGRLRAPWWSVCPGQAFPGQGRQVHVRPRHRAGFNGEGGAQGRKVMLTVTQKVR